MAFYVIGEIIDKKYKIIGYRIFSDEVMKYVDRYVADIIKALSRGVEIRGLEISNNGEIIHTYGYKTFMMDTNYLLPVVGDMHHISYLTLLGGDGRSLVFVNYNGTITKVLKENLKYGDRISKFRNTMNSRIYIENGEVCIKQRSKLSDLVVTGMDKYDKVNKKLSVLGQGILLDEKGGLILDRNITDEVLILPNNCKYIPSECFVDANIKKLILGKEVTRIESKAFIHSRIEVIENMKNVKTLGKNCFSFSHIKRIELGNLMTKLPSQSFNSAYSLEEIEIPSNIKSIGDYCFAYCSSLKKVIFQDGVEKIGIGAFSACRSLTYIRLPKTLKCEFYLYSWFDKIENITVDIPKELYRLNKEHIDKNRIKVTKLTQKDTELPNINITLY